MTTTILYFTRTGNTATLAQKLGKATNCTVFKLKDDETWYGPIGFLKGYWLSLTNKTMILSYDTAALDADHLVIMSPIWLQGPTPAVKTLLKEIKHDNITLVLTDFLSPLEGILTKYKKKYPNIQSTYGITQKKGNEADVYKTLVEMLSDTPNTAI